MLQLLDAIAQLSVAQLGLVVATAAILVVGAALLIIYRVMMKR